MAKPGAGVRLCGLKDLRSGAARGFDPQHTGADTVVLLRQRSGAPRAYLNQYPHTGGPLEYRKDRFMSADGTHVMCHAHGALFTADTGLCIYGPCLGQSLQAVPCWVERDAVWIWISE